MDKEAREAVALAARAAARAKLAAAGQVLPSAPGASAPPPAPSSFLAMDPSRKLLAVRTAFSLAGAVGVGGGGGGGGSSGGVPVGWSSAEDGAGRRYYYSRTLARSSWVRPSDGGSGGASLPSGWWEAEAWGGARYYFSAPFTNAQGVQGSLVTWERPSKSPFSAAPA